MGARVEQNDIRFARYRRAQITVHMRYLWYFAFDVCVCDRIAYTRAHENGGRRSLISSSREPRQQ